MKPNYLHPQAPIAYKPKIARQVRHNFNAVDGRYPLELDKQTLIDLYTTMLTIRRFEERAYNEFHAGNLVGFVHSYIGQEAIAVGVQSVKKTST